MCTNKKCMCDKIIIFFENLFWKKVCHMIKIIIRIIKIKARNKKWSTMSEKWQKWFKSSKSNMKNIQELYKKLDLLTQCCKLSKDD